MTSLSNTYNLVVTAISSINVDDVQGGKANEMDKAEHFDLCGRRISPTSKGVHIVKGADGRIKKLMVK